MLKQFLTTATAATQPAPTSLANLPTAAPHVNPMQSYVINSLWKAGNTRALAPAGLPDSGGGFPRPLVNAVYLGFFPHSGNANEMVIKLYGYNYLNGKFAPFSNSSQLTLTGATFVPIENIPTHLIIYPEIVSVANGDSVDAYIVSDPMCPVIEI